MSKELVSQTRGAFDFVEKLYFEVSYLIKEIEGILQRQEEKFVMGRPRGYAIATRASTGLEPADVECWLTKAATVFFCPKESTKISRGKTATAMDKKLKLLLLHIELADRDLNVPRILFGCIQNIKGKRPSIETKFEHLMWEFAYNREKIFSTIPEVSYEDSYVSFEGRFIEKPLFSIKNSDDVVSKLVTPMLDLYRETRA